MVQAGVGRWWWRHRNFGRRRRRAARGGTRAVPAWADRSVSGRYHVLVADRRLPSRSLGRGV